jgi:hypothetical protein
MHLMTEHIAHDVVPYHALYFTDRRADFLIEDRKTKQGLRHRGDLTAFPLQADSAVDPDVVEAMARIHQELVSNRHVYDPDAISDIIDQTRQDIVRIHDALSERAIALVFGGGHGHLTRAGLLVDVTTHDRTNHQMAEPVVEGLIGHTGLIKPSHPILAVGLVNRADIASPYHSRREIERSVLK